MIYSKSIAFYPPEITLIPVVENISPEIFFWCFSMCIATILLILLMSLIQEGKD